MNLDFPSGHAVDEAMAYISSHDQAQARIAAAVKILKERGWTERQLSALLDGLHRDDAVVTAEDTVLETSEDCPRCGCKAPEDGHGWIWCSNTRTMCGWGRTA